jgi:hypothetical protein
MRIPVLGCRVILYVALFVGGFGVGLVVFLIATTNWEALEDQLGLLEASAYPVVIVIALVGLYGLHHAARLDKPGWAWTGVIISGLIGIVFWIVLPFVVWAGVVLLSHDSKAAFRLNRMNEGESL